MREPKTEIIDGNEYVFTCLPPTKSLRALTRMLKIVVGPIGAALDNSNSIKEALGDIDAGTLLSGLADRLDEDVVLEIIKEFCSVILYEGKKLSVVMDAHFGGRVLSLLKVFGKALEIEYADFFGEGGLKGLVEMLEQKRAAMQDSNPAKRP